MINPLDKNNARRFFRIMTTTFFVLVIIYVVMLPFAGGFEMKGTVAPSGLEKQLEKESQLLKEYRERKLERANKAAELSSIETDMLDTKAAIAEQRSETDKAINEGIAEEFQEPTRLIPEAKAVKK